MFPDNCLQGGIAFAHLYLPVERWGPVCRKITSSVTARSARALNFPWKGDFFPAY